jgi:hypothetical protein
MLRLIGFCLALHLAACGTVFACEGKTTIFEDNFQDDSGGWEAEAFYSIQNGAMSIKFAPDRAGWGVTNGTFMAKNADICVDFQFPDKGLDLIPGLGLSFWQQDLDKGWYVAVLYEDGTLAVSRNFHRQWSTIFNQSGTNVHRGPGAKNRVRVTLKDDRVTVYVNDGKVKQFRAQPPPSESKFGIMSTRRKNGLEQVFLVTHYKVSSPD